MTSTTSRSVLIGGLLATTLLVGGRAQGQTGGTIGTGTGGTMGSAALLPSDFTILFESYVNGQWVQMKPTTQQFYFNQARCLCDTDPAGEFKIVVQPAAGAAQKIQTALQSSLNSQGVSYLFASTAGYDCLAPTSILGAGLGAFCTNLVAPDSGYPGTLFSTMAAFGMVNFMASPPIPVAYLFNSLSNPTCGYTGTCDSAALCSTTATQTNVQFWAQTNSGTAPDFDPGPMASVSLVGYVPVTPADVVANAANEALDVSWDWGGLNIATDATLSGIQIFCQRGSDTQVFPTGSFGPAYQTPAMLCPNSSVAAAATAGRPFSNFDPKYLCSGLIPAASTSHRITGLQNGIPYGIGVAAVDKYGNIGTISNIVYAAPGAGAGGTGGTLGVGDAGGATGGPDAEAIGDALDGGGDVGGGQVDGSGAVDAAAGAKLGSGCSCAICGKHNQSETAGILWLALVTVALARRDRSKVTRTLSLAAMLARVLWK